MKKRASKPEEGAVRGRAAGIEQYNSNVDRRTTQTGPLAFSAFVAVVAFLVVLGIGALVAGGFTVWPPWRCTSPWNGRKWWCSASASSPA